MKYCDSDTCDAEAVEVVRVSCNKAHDGRRHYCQQCYQMYLIGVQHGRFHEAAVHHAKPGEDSSQLKPHSKAWKEQQKIYDKPKESNAPSFQEAMKDQWSQWPSAEE